MIRDWQIKYENEVGCPACEIIYSVEKGKEPHMLNFEYGEWLGAIATAQERKIKGLLKIQAQMNAALYEMGAKNEM